MTFHKFEDGFKSARSSSGVKELKFGAETVPMFLNYHSVREAAKDWKRYSSDAPFRVPIPSEEKERNFRQLPIESDPPVHAQYRKLLEPIFRRPAQLDYLDRIDHLMDILILSAAQHSETDLVREFALPAQSRALTYMLGLDESEADVWINWGTHVFRDGDDSQKKGQGLESYLRAKLKTARAGAMNDDIFSILVAAEFEGRALSDDEILGMMNLVFAGGRDTIINSLTTIMAHFAGHADQLSKIVSSPRNINLATEEFVRALSPLSHIGRVCTGHIKIDQCERSPGQRVSLGWAAANYDPSIFQDPEILKLDRVPNPHVGFGSGPHNCLGAPQARALMRALIRALDRHKVSIEILEPVPNMERLGDITRQIGFERLSAKLSIGTTP